MIKITVNHLPHNFDYVPDLPQTICTKRLQLYVFVSSCASLHSALKISDTRDAFRVNVSITYWVNEAISCNLAGSSPF